MLKQLKEEEGEIEQLRAYMHLAGPEAAGVAPLPTCLPLCARSMCFLRSRPEEKVMAQPWQLCSGSSVFLLLLLVFATNCC